LTDAEFGAAVDLWTLKAPLGFDRWNPARRGAYRKGYEARAAGAPCLPPYRDKRTARGAPTWSRSIRNAWRQGWAKANEKLRSSPAIAPRAETWNPMDDLSLPDLFGRAMD
jgi:hypothetical protein